MADITVGVKHITQIGTIAEPGEQAIAAVGSKAAGAMWIQIGDVRLDTNDAGILGFNYIADGPDLHRFTITFTPGRFQTVQWDAE